MADHRRDTGRGRGGDEASGHAEASDDATPHADPIGDVGLPADADETADAESESRTARRPRVHVRRLDVVDTLRWSLVVLRDHRSLIGVALAANLPAVVAATGVSWPDPSTSPEVADWVLPTYLLQMVVTVVAGGVFYLTAADAVAERTRSLRTRVVTAVRRTPALVGTALLLVPIVAAGLAALVLPGVYLFHRLVVAFPACVIDGTGPVGSLTTSWRVAGGTVTKIFGVGLVYLGVGGASTVVSGMVGGPYSVVGTAATALVGAATYPLFGLALGHLYLESSRNR
ncbi:hypothetical protein [Halorussus salinisoli]|uniref:hypothetical protein n=1 Tax=Halorussus salinisoli TaxID=2558242 RepID=UPI0010C1DE71|nr:hypothetical protein [Halorussus salinisoli]